MLPEFSTPEEAAIQGDLADGLACPEAEEGVLEGMEDLLAMIIRASDRGPLDAPTKRRVVCGFSGRSSSWPTYVRSLRRFSSSRAETGWIFTNSTPFAFGGLGK